MSKSLTSIPTLVQSPFIIATIGGNTFGSYSSEGSSMSGVGLNVQYPNYMKSMSIIKVNGTVNTYALNLSYQVAAGQDPNLIDKILSRATKDRRITLQYGDWNSPNNIYKEEQAIITNVTSSLNMSEGSIDYTINCTSDAIGLTSVTHNFPSVEAKGSEVIMNLLNNQRLGITSIFKGMQNMSNVLNSNFIASNDKTIKLLAQTNMTVLDYLNYVVNSMISNDSDSSDLSNSNYYLSIHDDVDNLFGGTYFKVTEVNKNNTASVLNSLNTYELDVNYPGDNFVTEFSLSNDQSWAILYEYSEQLNQEKYSYKIGNDGKLITTAAPTILRSDYTGETSPTKSQWWTKMTQFPIEATITIKGLTRPSILMTYVKLNVWFAGGMKHISSGLYIITKQVDQIDSSGYKTTLTLLRVGGD